MKIVVETPTWLGDSVMLTPTLQNLERLFPEADITLIGSRVAIDILEGFEDNSFILQRKNRLRNIRNITKELGKVDIALSFRTSPYSGILQILSGAKTRVAIGKLSNRLFLTKAISPSPKLHQVEKYLTILEGISDEVEKLPLKLNFTPKQFSKPTLGINAGATYGSAKRWYPERFAKVIAELSDRYETILFGGKGEVDINREIEMLLKERGVSNFRNLAGKTSVRELAENIGGLDLFITNDSGPMHIGAAYGVPTVSIFGSTNHLQTDQWMNRESLIIRKEMECAPCMKRECPLKHHECMRSIEARDVLEGVEKLAIK
jgi:heptosyltransferase-2